MKNGLIVSKCNYKMISQLEADSRLIDINLSLISFKIP